MPRLIHNLCIPIYDLLNSTVFTCDLYQTYLAKNRPDSHYLTVGKWATVSGTLLSRLSAYIALNFDNLMDYTCS